MTFAVPSMIIVVPREMVVFIVIILVLDFFSVISPAIITSSSTKHGFLKFNDCEKYSEFLPGRYIPTNCEKE